VAAIVEGGRWQMGRQCGEVTVSMDGVARMAEVAVEKELVSSSSSSRGVT